MEEMLTVYWEQFVIFLTSFRLAFWPIYFKIIGGILIFSALRFIWFYATARKIDEWHHASIMVRGVQALYFKFVADEKERKKDKKDGYPRSTMRGGHFLGGLADALTWTILGFVLIWAWPAAIALFVVFGPIQLSHNYCLKKKTFIANLKGEELDT